MFRCLQSSSVLLANIREFCSDYLRMTGPECSRSLRMRPEGRSEQNDAHTAFDVQVCHFHAGPDNDCGAAGSDSRSRSGVRISSVQIIYRETGVTGRFAVKLRRRRAEPGAGVAQRPHHRELRRATSLWRAGLDGLRGIHRQCGRRKALRKTPADALVKARCAPDASDPNPSARRHAEGEVPELVSRSLPRADPRSLRTRPRCLTPRILMLPCVSEFA